ncbi:MAG TPA: elongation factor Ts [Dehalococcoidia bacterium]|nr:elongation factor Ts [Dehalococcoidia bacterium]
MVVSAERVRELRELTGAPILACKEALEEAGGSLDKAQEVLRQRGIALAKGLANRQTDQGVVHAYVHGEGRLGALIEVNCETDFVARTEVFRSLAHDLAMQVAAMNPVYISPEDVPPGADGDPKDLCLLAQPFIKDPSRAINDLLLEASAKTGEKVQIRRFARFELGS